MLTLIYIVGTLTVTTSCRNSTYANGGTCCDLVNGGAYCNCPQGFKGISCTEGRVIKNCNNLRYRGRLKFRPFNYITVLNYKSHHKLHVLGNYIFHINFG